MKIIASLIQAYVVCPKQAWLDARQLSGDQYNEFLMIGRLLSETSYKNEKKEVLISDGKIDIIKIDSGRLKIIEVKKSSKYLNAAKMQLLFYLKSLKNKHIEAVGELRIPKERKIEKVELTLENESELERIVEEMEKVINNDYPPVVEFKPKCRTCSHLEFCWS